MKCMAIASLEAQHKAMKSSTPKVNFFMITKDRTVSSSCSNFLTTMANLSLLSPVPNVQI